MSRRIDHLEHFVVKYYRLHGFLPAFEDLVKYACAGLTPPEPKVKVVRVEKETLVKVPVEIETLVPPDIPDEFVQHFEKRYFRAPQWSDVIAMAWVGLEPVPPKIQPMVPKDFSVRCPSCGAHGRRAKVKDSRDTSEHIRRRRLCECGASYTTVEVCTSPTKESTK